MLSEDVSFIDRLLSCCDARFVLDGLHHALKSQGKNIHSAVRMLVCCPAEVEDVDEYLVEMFSRRS